VATASRWQDLRDRCAAGLQLGAGLGPGDLRALRLGDVVNSGGPQPGRPWQLRVPASGSAPAHVAAIADWAGALLARWLAERLAQRLAGDMLLPSTRSGKPWGKVAQYEAAQRVLAAAGLGAGQGGSFRLRHSFALRQLQAGHDAEAVARWLGVIDPAVMQRYQRVLGDPAMPPAPRPRFSLPV
jgi:integrase